MEQLHNYKIKFIAVYIDHLKLETVNGYWKILWSEAINDFNGLL